MDPAKPVARKRDAKTKAPPAAPQTDPRVDAYLAKAAEFARPVLKHLRALVHAECAGAEETIKWGRPIFAHQGRILCAMAAFKTHCSLGFWQSEVIALIEKERLGKPAEGSGQFGPIRSLADLPDDATLRRYLAEAIRRLESGQPSRPRPPDGARRAQIPMPEDFAAQLAKHREAAAAFEGFSPTQRRDYLEWIVEAKREETRATRIATSLEWLAEGKPRHWKYAKC